MNSLDMRQGGRGQIIHESGDYWVSCEGPGCYYVWRMNTTHGVRCGTFSFPDDPEKARTMAIEFCDRRAASINLSGTIWSNLT